MSATHIINAILIAAILSFSSATAMSAEISGERSHPQTIRDPRYGEALFNFYQDQYFQAITNLMVAQIRSPITKQGDDPELLLGSLYLSYGMHRSAADIFERLLNSKIDPYASDLAWYYLGKLRYTDGDYLKAIDAFNAITSTLPKSRDGERLYLLSYSYLKENDYDKSAKVLDSLNGAGIWEYYTRYNLGIALLRNNRGIEGIRLLNQISLLTPHNEEEYALRDKANIAIGYASIGDASLADPVTYFSGVRLSGPFSNQALLGMGWAYSKNNRPKEAMIPWRELSSRPAIDMAFQESLIDIAYTFEQLGAPQMALTYYQNAIAAYDRDLSELTTALSATSYIDLLRSGIPAALANDEHQLTADAQLANLPVAEYLSDLFASSTFQKAYQDYHDLHHLRNQINQWNGKIPLLQSMLEERRRRYALNLAQIGESDYSSKLNGLYSRRAILIAQLDAVVFHADEQELATSKEHESLRRLVEIKARLSTLAKHGIDVTDSIGKYRILHGLIQWNVSTEYPARLWNIKRDMHALDNAFNRTAEIQSSLEKVQKSTPLDFAGFSKRISDSDSSLAKLAQKLDASINKQERYCADLILDTLNAKKRQIGIYRSRALYAQARLYDQLSHDPKIP